MTSVVCVGFAPHAPRWPEAWRSWRRRGSCHRGIVLDGGFVVDRFGSVVPSVFFELFTDFHELIDDLRSVAAGWFFGGSGPRVEGCGGFVGGSFPDAVEDAARDFLGLAELADRQGIRLGRVGSKLMIIARTRGGRTIVMSLTVPENICWNVHEVPRHGVHDVMRSCVHEVARLHTKSPEQHYPLRLFGTPSIQFGYTAGVATERSRNTRCGPGKAPEPVHQRPWPQDPGTTRPALDQPTEGKHRKGRKFLLNCFAVTKCCEGTLCI